MIVSGGENVHPAEVESVMTGHPAVAEVAVIGVPSAEWGSAPTPSSSGAHVTEADLIAWTRDRLAHPAARGSETPARRNTAEYGRPRGATRSSYGHPARASRPGSSVVR
jgi:acyl-CoA synthetase (AMP-forming)/AMP-acid ligase II